VRLFALGISSGILGIVFNNIAGNFQAIPVFGPVVFVLVLLVGHTGNILLSGLGSFVHPMRLTFVEFYNNSGFEGGGREYRPLALKNSK
jgi:V/A-type H+-transporting ATPase subunit I